MNLDFLIKKGIDALNGKDGINAFANAVPLINAINEGDIENIAKALPKEFFMPLINEQLFPKKGNTNVIIPKTNSNSCEESCIIIFHGCTDTAENFCNHAACIGTEFKCNVIFPEFNNFLSLNDNNILQTLGELFEEVYKQAEKYKNIIVFGYSLGVNIGALFCNFLLKKEKKFDFIGYKGYDKLMSCISKLCNLKKIINMFGDKFNIKAIKNIANNINDYDVDNIIKILLDDNYDNICKITNNSDNIGTVIKKSGMQQYLMGVYGDHSFFSGDIKAIYKKYTSEKSKCQESNVAILVYSDADEVVGNGNEVVFNNIQNNSYSTINLDFTKGNVNDESNPSGFCCCC